LHSGELYNFYSAADIITQIKSRRVRWAGYVARMGEEKRVYEVFVGKPEEKRPLGRQRSNGRMRLEWILWRLAGGGGRWSRFSFAQDRDRYRALVNTVIKPRVLVPRSSLVLYSFF
jgi:hypothetical protein